MVHVLTFIGKRMGDNAESVGFREFQTEKEANEFINEHERRSKYWYISVKVKPGDVIETTSGDDIAAAADCGNNIQCFTEETDRGEVKTSMESEGCGVSIDHEVTEEKSFPAEVEDIINEVQSWNLGDEYAKAYQDNLKESYILMDIDGLKTQLLYIQANTEEESHFYKRIDELVAHLNQSQS